MWLRKLAALPYPVTCRVVEHQANIPQWKYIGTSKVISLLTMDQFRNKDVIVPIIKTMYHRDRNTLVLSDRIEHLELLMGMCMEGDDAIPFSDMGAVYSTVHQLR